jgi:disulfide bond formation protein DsbB
LTRGLLYLCWLIALAGTGVSLYYSEIALWEPCALCWYQRIALFPLAVLLGVAAFRNDGDFALYGQILAGFGLVVALYHWLQLSVPALKLAALCGAGPTCVDSEHLVWGLYSFPALSTAGFSFLFLFLWLISCIER